MSSAPVQDSRGVSSAPAKNRFRFSLRTLLIVMLTTGCLLGLAARPILKARRIQKDTAVVLALGGRVSGEDSPAPTWLRSFVGEQYFGEVTGVSLAHRSINDQHLKCLERFPHVKNLDLTDTAITDAGLKHVGKCAELEVLRLNRTDITDAGLKELAGLPRLRYLDLWDTSITDAGMDQLAAISSLRHLNLNETLVTDAGALKLAKSTAPLQYIGFFSTEVTPDGAVALERALKRNIVQDGAPYPILHAVLKLPSGQLVRRLRGPFKIDWDLRDQQGRVTRSSSIGGSDFSSENLRWTQFPTEQDGEVTLSVSAGKHQFLPARFTVENGEPSVRKLVLETE